MPVRKEIQQIDGLDYLVEHGPVSLRRRNREPARTTSNPYPDFPIVMLAVGVVGDVFDDDTLRLVFFVEDYSKRWELARSFPLSLLYF